MNNKNSRKKLSVAVVAAIAVGSASVALVACGKDVNTDTVVGHINVPSATIQAELGTYVSPKYDVVNDYGLILAGYNVSLATVKDSSGTSLQVTNNSVLVETAGLYDFTYTAKSDRVKDVTIKIDFADRTAPTINFDASSLPSFFIKGNVYRIPSYTLSGDFVTEKCWTKVFHIADDTDKTETELDLIDGDSFAATHTSGKYRILIHVEDAVGNYNEYPYERDVDGPANFVEHKVAYFDEAFGARQASVYEPNKYSGGFVAKGTAGAQVHENENGSYKVSFDGTTETQYNEGLVYIHTPAVIDLTEYESLEMWVYNDTEQDNIIVGSNWWNDTTCKKGQWTKVTWSTRDWGGANGNKSADNRKFIGVTDISGQTVRIIFDYGQKIIPNGDVYFSAMTATPKTRANVTAKSENVILGASKYYVGDEVVLAAVEQDGKSIDCYTLNGKPIIGDSYIIPAEGNYEFDVVYQDGALTKDNMTWGTLDDPTLEYAGGNDNVWKYKIGEGDKWVISYDVYDVNENSYIGLFVGGQRKLIGFELNPGFTNGIKFASYGYPWDKNFPEFNPGGIKDMLTSATEASPVTITFARDGDKIKVFFTKDGVTTYFSTVDHTSLGVDNSFGLGERRTDQFKEFKRKNVRGIAGAEKVALYMEQFAATLKYTDCTSNAGSNVSLGDWVTLTANPAPTGKMFLHFTVDGNPISGNVMTVTKKEHRVVAVYTDKSTVTLGTGIVTTEGNKGVLDIAKGSVVNLIWRGEAPAGKYCTGFKVDGSPIDGNVFTANGTEHKVEAVFADRVANDNVALNKISVLNGSGGLVYQKEGKWKPSKVEYDTEVKYNGPDGAIETDGTLKVTLNGGECAFAFDNTIADASENLDKYKEIYFYVYVTDATAFNHIGGWWCRDTAPEAYKWVKVSFDRSKAPQNIDEQSVWEKGAKQFAYSVESGKAGSVMYVTPLYGVPYETSTISFDGTGIATADGKTQYHKEDEIKLVFNGTVPQGKIFDCFVVNGTPIGGDTFIAVEKNYTVSVKFATDVTDMTWGKVNSYQTQGDDAMAYKVGEGEQWVLRYDMTLPATGWNYFGAYVGGTAYSQLVGIEMNSANDTRIFGGYGGAWQQMSIVRELPTALREVLRNSKKNNSPVRVVYVRRGDDIDMYIRHIETNQGWHIGHVSFAAFSTDERPITGNSFGIGERTDNGLVNGELSNIEFITGEQKVNLYRNEVFKNYGEIVIDRPQETIFYTPGQAFKIPTDAYVADWLGNRNDTKTITIDRVENQIGQTMSVVNGSVTLTYKGMQIINAVYKADGCANKIVTYRLQPNDGTVLTPNQMYTPKTLEANGDNATVQYTNEKKHGDDTGSAKITVKKSESNGDYAYAAFDFGDYDLVEFYAYTESSGKQMGCHWYGDIDLNAGAWTKIQFGLNASNTPDYFGGKWVFRLMNFNVDDVVYISSVKLIKYSDYGNSVIDVSKGAKSGTWSTEKAYDGNDAAVDKTGALKLTVNSADMGVEVDMSAVNIRDIRKFSELYFYVWTDAENATGTVDYAGKSAMAGTQWTADTGLNKGQWTKVTIPSAKFNDIYPQVNSSSVAVHRMELFKFRFQNLNGATIYVTSLYGAK